MTAPAPPPAPAPADGPLRRLLGLLGGQRVPLVGGLLLSVPASGALVVQPTLLGRVTNLVVAGVLGRQLPAGISKQEALTELRAAGRTVTANLVAQTDVVPGHGVDFGRIGQLLLLMLLLGVVAAIASYTQVKLITLVAQRIGLRLRAQVSAKLARLPLRYYDEHPRGDLLSRVSIDVDNVVQSVSQTLMQVVRPVLTVIGALVLMVLIAPGLLPITLVTSAAMILATMYVGRRSRSWMRQQWASEGALSGYIEEMYTGHTVVRLFGRRAETEAEFEARNEAVYTAGVRAQFATGVAQPVTALLGSLSYVLIAVIGALRIASGSLSIGDVQAFIQYAQRFEQPVTDMAGLVNEVQSAMASAQRVLAVLDAPEERPDPTTPVTVDDVRGRVEFRGVSFGYLPGVPVIDNLSLTVEPGQLVAIVGSTGAGKTTLVNLLMRFYDVDRGQILVDGVDIATMRREDLRARTGMVLQETWLFDGTIAANIGYGADNPSSEAVLAAARATQVDSFVRTLPEGYQTVLDGEDGAVSAGEKQLITVARAFLAQPAVLILDEATSSVDTRTEVMMQQALSSLRAGRTTFVIAHRLSTIREADVIVVMANGRIVERGDHTTLLNRDGAYARLYAAQFASATDEPG